MIMIAEAIRLIITNIPAVLFLAALLIAAIPHGNRPVAERYLSWILLLGVGGEALWGGLFHILAPETAAAFIHWQVSPFQFEMGMADIALGVVGILSFWRSLDFKAAIVTFTSVLYAGLAWGHIHQIMSAGNLAPGNAGALLVLTIIKPPLLVGLLIAARRERVEFARHPAARLAH
jgi:hypothetical protein